MHRPAIDKNKTNGLAALTTQLIIAVESPRTATTLKLTWIVVVIKSHALCRNDVSNLDVEIDIKVLGQQETVARQGLFAIVVSDFGCVRFSQGHDI